MYLPIHYFHLYELNLLLPLIQRIANGRVKASRVLIVGDHVQLTVPGGSVVRVRHAWWDLMTFQ